MAGEAGTPVDDHAAGTADARATAEVELEARILLLTDDVQRDEQGHGAVFFHIKKTACAERRRDQADCTGTPRYAICDSF